MLHRGGRPNNTARMRSTPVVGSQSSQSQIAGVVKDSASMVKDGFRFTRAGFKRDKILDEPQGLEGGGLLGPTGDADADAEAFAAPIVDSRCSNWAPNEREQFAAYLTRRQAGAKARELELEPEPEPEPEPELQSGGLPRGPDGVAVASDWTREQRWSPSDARGVIRVAQVGPGDATFEPFDGGAVSVDPFDDLAERHSQDAGLDSRGRPNDVVPAAASHGSVSTNGAVIDRVAVGNLIDL